MNFERPSSKDRVFVAGHRGLVGSSIVRELGRRGFSNLVLKSHSELDLLDQRAVHRFFETEAIDYAYIAAARVGGIHANATRPADFLYENLVIAANTIHAAAVHGVKKLLFLGSSCIYPKLAPQPIREEYLLTGSLEPTNAPYAIAKIAGLELCASYQRQHQKRFISAMPTNLYGPGDNFHPDDSHVIPGMMRRFHEAKKARDACVTIWGTGTPRREFLHVDDLARALVLLMDVYEEAQTINVGTGTDCTIRELAETMARVVGFEGTIALDPTRPDGTPQKLLDVGRLCALGWTPAIELEAGLRATYAWALEHRAFE